METNMKYEEALRQLEAIVEKMENDELDVDELGVELKRAQQLIKLCNAKLTKTDEEIKNFVGRRQRQRRRINFCYILQCE